MKKMLYITGIILLFSCSESNKDQLYIDYINEFERITDHTDLMIDEAYEKSLKLSEDLMWGNPYKIEPWLKKVREISKMSDSIMNLTEEKKNSILKEQNSNKGTVKNLNGSKIRTDQIHFDRLEVKVNHYINYLDSILSLIKNADFLRKEIKQDPDMKKIFRLPVMKKRKANSLELYALLTMIQYHIKTVEYKITSFLHGQFDAACGYRFTNLNVFVLPDKKEISAGETFSAKIFLAAWDTTSVPIVLVNDQVLDVFDGKAVFKKRITSKDTGKVIEEGKIIKNIPGTKDTINILFKIEYTLVK